MQLFKHKTAFMHAAIQLAGYGYHRYTQGISTPAKFRSLFYKFTDRYAIDRTRQQRYRAKLKGQVNSRFLAWQDKKANRIYWILMVSDGEGIVCDLETLKDIHDKKKRMTLTGYELVILPKKEAKRAWTWRMTDETYAEWLERIKKAVRRADHGLVDQAMYSLRRVPGFHGIRKQAFKLAKKAKGEWTRNKKAGEWCHAGFYVGYIGKFKAPVMIDLKL